MVRETRYLWVGNLPHTIREERILEHFKRYGKVQSVKILPKKEEESGSCATVAFIDIKSASKAHNADNKIEDRTLKTDYYEPPASSTASSAIYIHERDDALVRPAQTPYTAGRTPRYGLAEERNYERPGHYYNDREPYLRRPLNISYHDEDNYQGRAKSRDRYPRTPGNNYTEGTERPQNHFRTHNSRQHFEQSRYPVSDQYNEEREPTNTTPRLNRRTNNNPATPAVASIASPNTIRTENRLRRTKRRSPSRTPSGSRSNSGSRSRSHSSSGSRSSSSSSKLRSSSSDSSGRSRSPSKSRSPVTASYGNQNNAKGSRLERPSSAIANPSSSVSYIPSTVNTPTVNCVSNNSQGSTPSQNCTVIGLENHSEKEEKRPQGICVRNLPVRSTDTSLKDGLFHEYKKHGKVTMVKVIGQGLDRYAVVCFKKPEDVDKALEVSKDKLFFGCKIEVTAHEGLDAEDNEFRPLEAELDEFHPKATRTLFIGNLEKDITTPDLRKHFDQFGEIIEIDIKKQGSASSYAFIQYSDIGSVVKAMRKLDGENLGANRIKLGFGKSMPTNCVWLDGIVESVSDKFLARHFSRFGIVVYTVIDREKGHALVFYENVEFAQIAVSEMRGRILQGKKLQVDFASRECQTTFFDKLEMSGQLIPGDGTRPWEQQRRERRGGPEFEGIRNDEREQRVGFENRPYPRYEGPPRPPRGNFRGGQRTGFSSRGRGQGFSARYEAYHDEFGERRHRYNSREDLVPEVTMFDSKLERPKYGEGNDISNRKRNKLRNSVSDQESHHSQSPPRSCHQSRSTSPVSKERKSFKDRLHHRIKSPGSHNSSLVNSPCRDTSLEEVETNSDYRDSRCKSDIKMDDSLADLSFSSPRSSSEKECSDKIPLKGDCDSLRSRSSLDGDSADEFCVTNDQLGQIERKKRFLASNFKSGKDLTLLVSKTLVERTKLKPPNSLLNSLKSSKLNCVSDPLEDNKCDSDDFSVQSDCVKDKFHLSDSMKKYDKKSTEMLSLFEQVSAHFETSDFDIFPGNDRLSRRKHRSPSSCSETNYENDVKSLTKEDCGVKLCKSGIKEPSAYNKNKSKLEVVDDNNCVSNSLDSFVFRKHLDPRKNFDPQSMNSLTNCRRISVDSDSCLPNTQTANEPFLSAVTTADISWKKQCNSISNLHFSENENSYIHSKLKEEIISDEETLNNKKYHIHNSSPLYSPKPFLRAFSDTTHCNDIKRERDISPLSLPLPKFAASLRSPKASPSVLTSPKTNTAHSPRAGLSPSSASNKTLRYSEFLSDIHFEKKNKCYLTDDKINNSTTFLADSISAHDSHDSTELLSNLESIQSPKTNTEKLKELQSSSESDLSPSASPSRPSIEDRIKALDEKFNAWSGSTRPAPAAVPETSPISVVDSSHFAVKRSRFNSLSDVVPEPSDIMKSLLARPTIVDQDCKRLQHIDEKYEPLNIKMDTLPKIKPTFRTKAAAKEFSTPIIPPAPSFNQPPPICKNAATVLVAQGIMSPPNTPIGAASSILSPVTPPIQQLNSQITTPPVYTPSSPCSSFNVSTATNKMIETFNTNFEKDICDSSLKSVSNVFTSAKAKTDPNFHTNSTMLATSLKSPLHCPMEIPAHSMVLNSPPSIKKEPASPTDSVTEAVCKIDGDIKYVKKEMHKPSSAQTKRENITFTTKDNPHYSSFDLDKKEFCDSKDPRLSFHEDATQWREVGCKDDIKGNVDACAKSFISTPDSDNLAKPLHPAVKKRVSSIDSNESESSKSVKSLESSRDSHDLNWAKHDKSSEPEPKRPKLSKCVRDRSPSPPTLHTNSKKIEKKEKCSKGEKSKSSKSSISCNPERSKSDSKHNKSESKDKPRSDVKSKEEKRSKSKDSKESQVKSESKDSKDTHTKNEAKSKSKERRNSEKDSKHVLSSSSMNTSKNKKESSSTKAEKKDVEKPNEKPFEKGHEKKKGDEKEKKSSSKSKKLEKQLEFDFLAFMDDEPVYFSMYDKVKARSSKTQTMKHQTNDLESVRQKFSKLKQSRAKREEKSKSIDNDSDRDSDSCSQHSSESDSQAARSSKMKQARKRKLVIESSSDDNAAHHDSSRTVKMEKDLSDSDTDSEFDYNVSHRQSISMKSRKKKTEIFNTDSSDSESNYLEKSQTNTKKKSSQSRNKSRPEKSRKSIKSDNDHSESDYHSKSKEKEGKPKKVKCDKNQESKQETDTDFEIQKKASDDLKSFKKKSSKEHKQELEISTTQKKLKSDHLTKEKHNTVKEKKNEPPTEKMHVDDIDKQKTYSKKRKKSKKMSKNREKRNFIDKTFHDSARNLEECDSKLSLPVLSPKPSNQLSEKQNSPPCLQVGILLDNDYKSDFSDYDFETQPDEEMDVHSDAWSKKEGKSDSSSEKSSKSKKKDIGQEPPPSIQSPEQESSLPSFFDKLSDITDSETGKDPNDCTSDVPSDGPKHNFSLKKEKETFISSTPHKIKQDKNENQMNSGEYLKHFESHHSREEKRKKKSKKQSKERKKKSQEKVKEEVTPSLEIKHCSTPVLSPKLPFEAFPIDDDSRLSDIRLDEEIAEEARRLEEELLAVSEETNTFGDEGPSKKEEKLLERRFEEEAAKEARRLEEELFSTGRDSWHMKEKDYDSEVNSCDLNEDKHASEIDSLDVKEDNVFTGLDLHSSITEPSQTEVDTFLTGQNEADPYKIDDKDMSNEIEDQRKIEDDLAVSALLQEMHCGEISAPELTKETDYLDPIIETHPEDTMNYLLPDDGDNSLHIADGSPDVQESDIPEEKLGSPVMMLSPSSNSEPPALEISNIEDSSSLKIDTVPENDVSEPVKLDSVKDDESNFDIRNSPCYEFENSLSICETKPPVITIPEIPDTPEPINDFVSPKIERCKPSKNKEPEKSFVLPEKLESTNYSDGKNELKDNQLTHFEDITMDITDKDDDNPPVLLPVESPPNLIPAVECKEKVETFSRIEVSENPTFDNVPSKAEAVVLDLVKDLDDMFDTKIQPKIESNISRYTDYRDKPMSHSISISADQINTDPLRLNTTDIFENFKSCQLSTPSFDSSPILKPAHKSFNASINSPNCYSDQMNLDKYNFSEHSISKDPPNLSYTDILNTRCETSVIQSVPKTESNDQHNNLTSICDKNTISDDLFMQDRELNDLNEANPNSSENFLLELFPPKSNENSHKDSPSSEKLKSEDFYFETDLKTKPAETEKPSSTLNQEDSTVSSFEIPEVNEQNEATEFNQDIFEPSVDENKETKLPQLLSFTSDQLFTENFENKCSSPSSNNLSENTTRDFSGNEDITQEFDSLTKSENIEEETSTSMGMEDNYSKTDCFKNDDNQSEKNFENLGLNLEDDFSSKPVDAESICSDTTDITVSDAKMDLEENHSTSNVEATLEEPANEDISSQEELQGLHIIDESSTVTKSKTERPRRGRRPKTRKYVEALSQKQEVHLDVPVAPQNRASSRRARPTSSERVRRSLRSDTSEVIPIKEVGRRHVPLEDIAISDNDEVKKDNEDIVETCLVDESAEKSQTKVEEPKRRRGRRKKNSGDTQTPQSNNKPDSKLEELESSKEHNRSKESRFRLSISSDKEQKSTKDNSNAMDVYDFCEEEDEGAINSFKDIKDRLHDTSRNIEFKHEKMSETSTEKERKPKEQKHDKLSDVIVEKDKKPKDQKHEKQVDICLDKDKKSKESKHEKSSENVEKDKKSKEQKHDKFADNIFEKDKKIEDIKRSTSGEEREIIVKEHHTDHPKISMTIRLNKKEGNDGTSPCIAEVVKTSEALNIEESKPEPQKVEKPVAKQEPATPEVPYNGPCKSTRKSTRLMNQGRSAELRSLDVTIEEVIKSHSEPIQTRSSRRSKASRRSEDSLPIMSSENSEDTSDDKNKNEPVFFIHDNAVKDIPEDKKLTSSHSIDTSSASDIASASDKTPNRILNLRSFRMARQAAAKLEATKDTSSLSANVGDIDVQKKDKSRRSSLDEKMCSIQQKDKDNSGSVKELKSPVICQPELKVEISRINIDITKEKITKTPPEKISECNEESNSSSSTAFLLDPVTGILVTATSNESYSETLLQSSENKTQSTISLSDMSSIQLSKPIPVPEIHSNPSVIQENSKVTDNLQFEKSSLVHSLRSRQQLNSNQITNLSSPSLPCTNVDVKPKIIVDASVEPRKDKNIVSAAGVLTTTNTVLNSVTSIQTKSLTEVANTCNLSNTGVQEKSVVVAAHVPAITTAHEISAPDRDRTEIIQSKVPQLPIHNYHASNKMPVAVTTSTVALTTTVTTTTSTKCYTAAVVIPKTEPPSSYCSIKTTSPSIHEHSSSTASQPISSVVHTPSEHSIVTIKQEPLSITPPLHPTPPSTTASHNIPVTWPGLNKAAPRVVDLLAHAMQVQGNTNKTNAFTGKHERSSKVHHSKNNSAFSDQTGFPMPAYETMLPSAHALVTATGNSGGVIAEILQNPQYLQQHKDYYSQTGQLQDRIQVPLVRPSTPVASSIPPELAARLAPTPPHTPTPPVTSSNHPMQSSEMYTPHVNSPLMLRHQAPPSLIVPQHPVMPLHQSDYNAYVHHQMMYANHSYAAINDLRAQEAQTRAAIGMNPRFPYNVTPPIPSNFKQPSDPRHHLDGKADPKSSELAKIMHESRSTEEKSQLVGKSLRSKKEYTSLQKEKEIKSLSTENRDHHDSNRHISTHEQKIPSTSAIAPHNLRQQQNTHFSSGIHQLSPRLNVSPHDRISDSPGIANLYAAGPGRVPQITLAGQVDDRKSENVGSLPPHHYKNDVPETIKPPVAHQAQPSTNLYALEGVHSRQPMLGGMQLGATGSHIDSRTSNTSHSPTPHAYKKDSNQSLQVPLHISVNDKRLNTDHSKKYHHSRNLGHQASISPGPVGLGPARSPVPWPAVIQTHNSHSSLPQSSHHILPNEPPSRRVGAHMPMTEVSPLVPPPAHRVPEQVPPRISEPHNVGSFLQKYPVMWQGLLALKNDQAAVQMHFVTGNVEIARASLPPLIDGESAPVRVAQRMRLDTQQLEGVQKKLQLVDEHCVLLALPCGKNQMDVLKQSNNLNMGFINYLQQKQAAGIVNVATPGSQQPAYVIHIFPSCEFTNERVQAIAPDLPQIISDMSHLFIVIATV